MSYDIYFQKDGRTLEIPFTPPIGGTYCIDKDFREAWLNITFNYARIFYQHGLAIVYRNDDKPETKVLNGKTAKEVVAILSDVIPTFKDDVSDDYWEATEGNAKAALINLLSIAVAVPKDALCVVDY